MQFCVLSLWWLSKELKGVYAFFTGKLNTGVDTIQHGVEGLMYLLTESSKLMVRILLCGRFRNTLTWCLLNNSCFKNTDEWGKSSTKF